MAFTNRIRFALERGTLRLTRLIDNLLNLARIESGVVKVNKEPTSLNELLKIMGDEALGVVTASWYSAQIVLRPTPSGMWTRPWECRWRVTPRSRRWPDFRGNLPIVAGSLGALESATKSRAASGR